MKRVILGVSVFLLSAFFSLCFAADPAPSLLDETAGKIASTFRGIDADISKTARLIGEGVYPAAGMREALRGLCTGKSYVIDCVFINAKGIMEIVEPERYRKYEGSNLSDQAVLRTIQKTRKPVFSELFMAAEGLQGIVFEYPVFNSKKQFAGSVSLFVAPELLVRDALKDVRFARGTSITIVQPDGTNVYCSDPGQTRLNALKSSEYKGFPELHTVVRRIVKEEQGAGTYRYVKPGTETVVKKSAVWKTVPFYDSYWRVAITTEAH